MKARRGVRGLLPSFSIPTLRHFMKRQAWQDLRLRFVISHSLVAGQLYSMLPVTRTDGVARCHAGLPAQSKSWTGVNRPDVHCPHSEVPIGHWFSKWVLRGTCRNVSNSFKYRHPRSRGLGGPGSLSFTDWSPTGLGNQTHRGAVLGLRGTSVSPCGIWKPFTIGFSENKHEPGSTADKVLRSKKTIEPQ